MVHRQVGSPYLPVAIVAHAFCGFFHPPGRTTEMPGLFFLLLYILFGYYLLINIHVILVILFEKAKIPYL